MGTGGSRGAMTSLSVYAMLLGRMVDMAREVILENQMRSRENEMTVRAETEINDDYLICEYQERSEQRSLCRY